MIPKSGPSWFCNLIPLSGTSLCAVHHAVQSLQALYQGTSASSQDQIVLLLMLGIPTRLCPGFVNSVYTLGVGTENKPAKPSVKQTFVPPVKFYLLGYLTQVCHSWFHFCSAENTVGWISALPPLPQWRHPLLLLLLLLQSTFTKQEI